MRNFWTVLKFEYVGMVWKRSFLIGVLVFAVILIAAANFPLIHGFIFGGADEYEDIAEVESVGVFYDASGWYTPEVVTAFAPHFEWAQITSYGEIEAMLEAGDADIGLHLTAEGVTVFLPGSDWMGGGSWIFEEMARTMGQVNLLEQVGVDSDIIQDVAMMAPEFETIIVGRDGASSYWITLVFVTLLMSMVSASGNIVAQSVAAEKTSRAIELLSISTSANSLIFGKVIGVALVSLSQFAVILIPVALVMYANLANWHTFSPMIGSIIEVFFASNVLPLAFVFFLLTFFIFAFAFAALSSTVSRAEDLGSALTIPSLILTGAYFAAFSALFAPMALHVQILSYVPFFAPLVMMARATMVEIPTFNILLSIGVSLLHIILLGVISAKIYRIGIMLTGNKPNFRQIFKMMRRS